MERCNAIRIQDCLKGFSDGAIGKVVAPSHTCEMVLERIKRINPPIYQSHIFIQRPTGIPQYRIVGTEYYREITGFTGTNGKGHTSEQALASGLMEMVERYSCHRYLKHKYVISSWDELPGNIFSLNDFYSQFLDVKRVRIVSDDQVRTFRARWYKGRSWEGKNVYIPVSLNRFILQCANGMASGNSHEEALLHAICEVIERHCVTLVKYTGLIPPTIDQSTICSPLAGELLEMCRLLDPDLQIRDFSLGFGLPVIGVITRSGGKGCLITVGVATNPEEALVRALTETSQASGMGAEVDSICHVRHCLNKTRAIPFGDIPCIENNNIRLEIEAVIALLRKQALRVFYVNTTDSFLKIPSVDVFIAGAKYFHKNALPRTVVAGYLNESFATGNIESAKKYIAYGIDRGGQEEGLYHYYRGILLINKGRQKEAIRAFKKALNSPEPGALREDVLSALGVCYEIKGDMDSAMRAYTRQVDLADGEWSEIAGKNSRIFFSLPENRFIKEKNLYETIRCVRWRSAKMGQQSFIDEFNRFLLARTNVWRCLKSCIGYYDNGRWDKAIVKARAAFALHGFVDKIYELNLFLAECFLRLGKFQYSIKELRKAERLDPDNEKINFELARCYKLIRRTERYQKELDKGFLKVATSIRMKVDLSVKPEGRAGWIKKVW